MIKAEDNINLVSGKSTHDLASNTEQHFWNVTTGTNAGVHITEKTKDDFLDDPANGGNNLWAKTNGIVIRKGTTELASFEESSIGLGKNSDTAVINLCNGAGQIKGEIASTLATDDTYSLQLLNVENTKACKELFMRCGLTRVILDDFGNSEGGFSIFSGQGVPSTTRTGTCAVVGESESASASHVDIEAGGASVDVRSGSADDQYTFPHVIVSGRFIVPNNPIQNEWAYSNTNTGTPNINIASTGIIRRTTTVSSRRYKHDIKDVEDKTLDPQHLYDVEVKQFKYNDGIVTDSNDSRYDKDLIGFIAEQVKDVYPIAVDVNEQGECEAWNAQYIIPPMLKLIQDQHKQIETLTQRIEALERATK